MQDLISVIVPVYKVEKYLDECVTSILNQTYKNLEIILVDDGSPDNCPKMCDNYAANDSRIKVIHKNNGGLSSARNAGLDVAKGSFIQFVDSDDVIDINMIQHLYNNLKTTDSDISCCLYYKSDKEMGGLSKEPYKITTFSNLEILNDLYCKKLQNVISCNKLFRKSLFQEIYFPVGKICEDIFTIYKLMYKAKKIVKSSFIGYFYRQTPGSITNVFNIKRLDSLEAYKECNYFFENKDLSSLKTKNAICALIAIMRFSYLNKDKKIKHILNDYYCFFYNIAKESRLGFFRFRCFIYRYFPILNNLLLCLADLYRNFTYKSKPNIMG